MQGEPRPGLSDEALLAAVATGCPEALGAIVERHQGAVYRYALALTRNQQQAEDVLQQAFLDALRGAGGFRGDAAVRSWLLTLTRHAAFRGARRRVGEPEFFTPLQELGSLAGWGASPEDAAARALDSAALQRALATLPAHSQEVLILRDLEGLSGAEAAAILDIGVPALKTRLHRARLALAAALRREMSDGP